MGKKEFEPVCTPDGWTLPSKSFIGSLNETRYKRLTSRSNEIDFAVSNLGFSVFDEDEVPHLVHQDPKHQIDM